MAPDKINAAQASHSGRIEREYPGCSGLPREAVGRPPSAQPLSEKSGELQPAPGTLAVRIQRESRQPKPRLAGLVEEAATPGQSSSRRKAPLEPSPAIHPRESPGTASVSTLLQQDAQDILRLRGSTVPEPRGRLKGKVWRFCAEAVEDRTLLWKGMEKV